MEAQRLRLILSANMKARRKVLKVSQEKLAELVDVSTQTIWDIENCRSWVSDKTISRLAEALGVEVFQLFVPGENAKNTLYKEESVSIPAALLRLRQDIKSELGASIETVVNERFSRFLRDELDPA